MVRNYPSIVGEAEVEFAFGRNVGVSSDFLAKKKRENQNSI